MPEEASGEIVISNEDRDARPILEATVEKPGKKDKSANLLRYLHDGREKLGEEANHKFDINDVMYFFKARDRDIAKKPLEADARAKFNSMSETIINTVAGEHMSPAQQKDVLDYLSDFYKEWDREAVTPSGEFEESDIKLNLQIFQSLIETVKNQPLDENKKTEDVTKQETVPEATVVPVEQRSEGPQEQLPEVNYVAHKTDEFLDNFKEEESSLQSVHSFLNAAKEDVKGQSEKFEAEHAGLIMAVDAARDFGLKHQGEVIKLDQIGGDKLITVTIYNGEVSNAGWTEDQPDDIQGITYKFDPRTFSDNEYNLGKYVEHRMQFKDRLEGKEEGGGINDAIEKVKELSSGPKTKATKEELLPIQQVIETHVLYLDNQKGQIDLQFDGDESKMAGDQEANTQYQKLEHRRAVLSEFAELLKERVKPEGKTRRLFKGAQTKLKEFRQKRNKTG